MHAVGQKPIGRIELRMQVDNFYTFPCRDFLDDGVYLVHDCRVHDSPPAVVGIGLQRRDDSRACRQVCERVDKRFVVLVQIFLIVLSVVVVVLGLPVCSDAVVAEELAVVCPELYDDYIGVETERRLEVVRFPVARVVRARLDDFAGECHAGDSEILHAVAVAQHLLQSERVVFLPAEPVAFGNAVAYARHAGLRICHACEPRENGRYCSRFEYMSKHHAYNIILWGAPVTG